MCVVAAWTRGEHRWTPSAPSIRPATLADCEFLAPRLRAADLQEIEALDGSLPLPALVESFDASSLARVMEHNGEPFAIYGVAPAQRCSDYTMGVSWMLGSDGLKDHSMWFLRNCRGMLEEMHTDADVLFNMVDVRNIVHINWLKWAGFSFGQKHPHNGTDFWVHWRNKECA